MKQQNNILRANSDCIDIIFAGMHCIVFGFINFCSNSWMLSLLLYFNKHIYWAKLQSILRHILHTEFKFQKNVSLNPQRKMITNKWFNAAINQPVSCLT